MNSLTNSTTTSFRNFRARFKSLSLVFITSLFWLSPTTSVAQNKVVVVPLGGDSISSLPAFPQVWAQVDGNSGGTSVADSGQIEINSIQINAPSDGFLVINGQSFINASSPTTPTSYVLRAKLDGNFVSTVNFDGSVRLDADGEIGFGTSIYTVTTPVTAGAHTVSQDLGPFSGVASFFHNRESLTVMFFATGDVSSRNSGAVSSRSSKELGGSGLDEEGN